MPSKFISRTSRRCSVYNRSIEPNWQYTAVKNWQKNDFYYPPLPRYLIKNSVAFCWWCGCCCYCLRWKSIKKIFLSFVINFFFLSPGLAFQISLNIFLILPWSRDYRMVFLYSIFEPTRNVNSYLPRSTSYNFFPFRFVFSFHFHITLVILLNMNAFWILYDSSVFMKHL